MSAKRKIEIFSAGCPPCVEAISLVESTACPSCEVAVLDMRQPAVAAKAKQYGIQRVPAVMIDEKLAVCCAVPAVAPASLRPRALEYLCSRLVPGPQP